MSGSSSDVATAVGELTLGAPDEPVVAVAQLYTPGAHQDTGVAVMGVAVGQPVARRMPSNEPALEAAAQAADVAPGSSAVVAESFLYSPQMAKIFAQFDYDQSGTLDVQELRKLLDAIGLQEEDAAAALSCFDTNDDTQIQLSEWERGLDSRIRAVIEKKIDAEGKIA